MNKNQSNETEPVAAVACTDLLGDDLLPVKKPLSRISIHLMVNTPHPIMDQIAFDVTPEQAESLKEAEHLMVHISIWEGEGNGPSREGHLVFPPGMFRPQPQSNRVSPLCASDPNPSQPI
jgi:hypothetical protein